MLRKHSHGFAGTGLTCTLHIVAAIVGIRAAACVAADPPAETAEPSASQNFQVTSKELAPTAPQQEPFDINRVEPALLRELTEEWMNLKRKRPPRKSNTRVTDPSGEVEVIARRLGELERQLHVLGASGRQIRELYRSIDERHRRRRSTDELLRKAIVALERDRYTLRRLDRAGSDATADVVDEARKYFEQDQRIVDELEDELHSLGISWAEIEANNIDEVAQVEGQIRQLGKSSQMREQTWVASIKAIQAMRMHMEKQESLPPQEVDEGLLRSLEQAWQSEERELERLGRMLRAMGMSAEDQERIEAAFAAQPEVLPGGKAALLPGAPAGNNPDGRLRPTDGPLGRSIDVPVRRALERR
jgi:hypothetical protein